tara:strand:- start:141 stop:317 length:177 start_codon:yes stop_codon:yes gene_type:complete
MNDEQLFDHIEGLMCFVGEVIDAYTAQNSDLDEIYEWVEDILLEYGKQINIGKRGETR